MNSLMAYMIRYQVFKNMCNVYYNNSNNNNPKNDNKNKNQNNIIIIIIIIILLSVSIQAHLVTMLHLICSVVFCSFICIRVY